MGEKFTSRVGYLIRNFRIASDMTQKELADKCGLNESTIRNYELGNSGGKAPLRNRAAKLFIITRPSIQRQIRRASATMRPSCSATLLSDYNSLPEIEQNRVGKYLKNLVRIHKAIASLNFADRQVNWELSKQRIEPYTEAEEIKCSFCKQIQVMKLKMIVASDDVCICNECVGLCSEVLQEEIDKK